MMAKRIEERTTVEFPNEREIKNRLAAAEFDAKLVAGHRRDGSHPNLMEI
jgi:hypothetical protein